jgi:hypothetical protein
LSLAQTKLDLVEVGSDADVFTAREIALTKHTAKRGRSTQRSEDEAHNNARKEFSDDEQALLTIAIAGINACNGLRWRIASRIRYHKTEHMSREK